MSVSPWLNHGCKPTVAHHKPVPDYYMGFDHIKKTVIVSCAPCGNQWEHPQGPILFGAYVKGYEDAMNRVQAKIGSIITPTSDLLSKPDANSCERQNRSKPRSR